MLSMGRPHTKPPPYDFLNLYGARLQAPRTPKVVAVLHGSRFPCLTPIAGQIIYYLTRGVPGGQITRYFDYHSS
jgi:hypothetical protein